MRTFAIKAHVASSLCAIFIARYGAVAAWPTIRILWLASALDGRVPLRNVKWDEAPDGIQPEVPCWRLGEEVWN